MHTLTISSNAFRTVLPAMAIKEHGRPYLMGAYLDTQHAALVGTDGHLLAAYRLTTHELHELAGIPSVIIPPDLVKHAAKMAGNVDVTIDGNALTVAGLSGTAVDGRYPDWTRVFPDRVSGETAQFDPAVLASAVKCYRAAIGNTKAKPFIRHNGESAAIIECIEAGYKRAYALIVVMPCRITANAEYAKPEWSTSKLADAA